MTGKVLVVTIEAMEISLVRQGLAEGWLPAIAGLLEEGAAVGMHRAPDLLPGAAWTTMFTGHPVEDHLLIFDRQLAAGTTRIEDVEPGMARATVFWKLVSDAGMRTTVASVYGAPQLETFNGTQVHWGTAEPFTSKYGKPWSDRPEVLGWLNEACPDRRFGFLERIPRSPADYRRYVDWVVQQIRMQGEGLALLMERTEWDLFLGNIYDVHEAGHLLWHLQADHDLEGLHQPLKRVYQAADAALGRLLEKRGSNLRTFVMTTSGMGPMHPTHLATGSFLRQGGWMAQGERGSVGTGDRKVVWATRARSALHKVAPLAVRRALSELAPGAHARLATASALLGVDWSATTAFPLPNDTTSAIRFNVAGREPEGAVTLGDHYDRVADEMAAAVGDLVDADTGAPAAQAVYRMDQVIGRPIGDVLPDLVVDWQPAVGSALDSPRTGRIEVPTDIRTGDHRPEGFVIGAGPGVSHRSGGLDGADPRPHGLLDVAPTILSALGVPVPPEMTGRPINALLPAS